MYDVVVIGLGAMGSSAAFHLAARGLRVAGIDRFDPPHALGSTHGRTRIIREAYYEHPVYVPFVRQAYEQWSALERMSGTTLFQRTGGLMLGSEASELLQGTLASAREHLIAIEVLESSEIRRRFPAIAPDPPMIGVLEKRAGLLFPEACVSAHLAMARKLGAELHTNTAVSALELTADGLTVHTSDNIFRARKVVLAAGPWMSGLLSMVGVEFPLTVERQTMHWLEGGYPAVTGPERMPLLMVETHDNRLFYATPDVGDGVKAALHHGGAFVNIDYVPRAVTVEDTEPVLTLAARYLPGAGGRIRESAVCLYTDTPDRDFVIDTVCDGNVVVTSACSGHGFKFASVVGMLACQLALDEEPALDVSAFRSNRFASGNRR